MMFTCRNCQRSLLIEPEMCEGYFIFFFFSSRRRHTSSLCDWSSDVCSSDLAGLAAVLVAVPVLGGGVGGGCCERDGRVDLRPRDQRCDHCHGRGHCSTVEISVVQRLTDVADLVGGGLVQAFGFAVVLGAFHAVTTTRTAPRTSTATLTRATV